VRHGSPHPARLQLAIVVDEGEPVGLRFEEGALAREGEPLALLAHVAVGAPRAFEDLAHDLRRFVGAVVVHDEDG
jgi:hypothetical protein